eukprot:m.18711 g.18711  ORF g.18711 m.18711 type:complete len:299 (-) comp12170_c0_seq1:133-1029(-)
MGASSSSRSPTAKAPAPNVKERHLRALYINIPIPVTTLAKLLTAPAVPDVHNGSAWISICVDDLYYLKLPVLGGWMSVPGMNGWMIKVNALVKCPVAPGEEPISGYQILTLDFERTWGPTAKLKRNGAMDTQKIPTTLADFDMSSGKSGNTPASSMDVDTPYSASVTCTTEDSATAMELISITGRLSPLVDSELDTASIYGPLADLCAFVVGRTTKYLAQQKFDASLDRVLAYATWQQPSSCESTGCVRVITDSIALPILDRVAHNLGLTSANLTKQAICFLQPEYNIIDVENTVVMQ